MYNIKILFKFILIIIIIIQTALLHQCKASNLCLSDKGERLYMYAEIYFIPWDTLTRIRQSPNDIRKYKDFYLRIEGDYVQKVLDSIKSIEFNKYDGSGGDARFVMDIHKSDNTVLTYYSDGWFVYSSESKCYGKITLNFLSAINFFKK
jgi:hypothetical protein